MLSRRQKIKKGNDKEKHKLTMQGCEIVLRKIAHHRLSDPFLTPVDLELYPDYQTMVRKPMDFSTVWKKVKGKGIHGVFVVVLVFVLVFVLVLVLVLVLCGCACALWLCLCFVVVLVFVLCGCVCAWSMLERPSKTLPVVMYTCTDITPFLRRIQTGKTLQRQQEQICPRHAVGHSELHDVQRRTSTDLCRRQRVGSVVRIPLPSVGGGHQPHTI